MLFLYDILMLLSAVSELFIVNITFWCTTITKLSLTVIGNAFHGCAFYWTLNSLRGKTIYFQFSFLALTSVYDMQSI